MSEKSKPIAATEEEKRGLLKALREFLAMIGSGFKYMMTHSRYGMVGEQLERIAEAIEEQIENNELDAQKTKELTELFTSIQGEMDSLTPEKIIETIDKAEKIVGEGLFLPSMDSVEFFQRIEAELERDFIKNGKEVPNDLKEKIRKATLITIDGQDKILMEIDDVLLEADYQLKENKVHFCVSNLKKSDIESDGALKDGYGFAEIKYGSVEHDLMNEFCKKNNLEYYFNKEDVMKQIDESLSPVAKFIMSRSETAENGEPTIVLSEDNKYESHYFLQEGVFSVRDKENKNILNVMSKKGEIEFYLSENNEKLDISNIGTKIGQIKQEGKNIETRLTLPSILVSSMFHSDEISRYLELSGISKEQQKGLFLRPDNKEYSKVQEAGIPNVEKLKDACIKACETKGEYNVYLQNKSSKHTFLVITPKQENSTQSASSISFAFDENGNVKALNYREADKPYKFMFSPETRSVSADFHRLQDDKEFIELYNVAMEALNDVEQIKSQELETNFNPYEYISHKQPEVVEEIEFEEIKKTQEDLLWEEYKYDNIKTMFKREEYSYMNFEYYQEHIDDIEKARIVSELANDVIRYGEINPKDYKYVAPQKLKEAFAELENLGIASKDDKLNSYSPVITKREFKIMMNEMSKTEEDFRKYLLLESVSNDFYAFYHNTRFDGKTSDFEKFVENKTAKTQEPTEQATDTTDKPNKEDSKSHKENSKSHKDDLGR